MYSGPYPYPKMSLLNSVFKENALEENLAGKFKKMESRSNRKMEEVAVKFEKLEKRSANCVFRYVIFI